MTGRRLYDLLCDAHAKRFNNARANSHILDETPPAWLFLPLGDRLTLNDAAKRLKCGKR